jgi:hypothetical protein
LHLDYRQGWLGLDARTFLHIEAPPLQHHA